MIKIKSFFIISLFLFPFILNAQVIKSLNENLKFDESGNAELNVIVKSDKSYFKEILIPFNFKGDIKEIKSNNGLIAKNITIQGINYLYVTKKDSGSFKECNVQLKIEKYFDFSKEQIEDYGNYLIKYRFINTRFAKIDKYSVKIILPKKFNITSVDESIPKATEDSPKSPFVLGKEKDNYFVELLGDNVKLGENLFIKFRFKENNRSLLLGLLLGAVAIGYLIIFRDLRKPKAEK